MKVRVVSVRFRGQNHVNSMPTHNREIQRSSPMWQNPKASNNRLHIQERCGDRRQSRSPCRHAKDDNGKEPEHAGCICTR